LTFAITHDELLWQVSSRIREDLLARAGEFNIKLEDVSITHLTFGKVCVLYDPMFERENLIFLALGIYASCRGEADRPTRYVTRHTRLMLSHSCTWLVDAERAKFIVEKVGCKLERLNVNGLMVVDNRRSKSDKLLSFEQKVKPRLRRRYRGRWTRRVRRL
jgi:hypothetical protein